MSFIIRYIEMRYKIKISTLPALVAIMFALAICTPSAFALPASKYAATSRLASGRWVRVSVSNTGMQRITAAQLRQMGFTDPSKVNVYGYGGRRLSENLTASMPDDLPLQPCVRADGGITFWGVGTVGVDTYYNEFQPDIIWRQSQNPYSTKSYYFLSDCDPGDTAMPVIESAARAEAPLTTFTDLAYHEVETVNQGESGTLYLGEDFRTQTSQTFTLDIPGRAADEVALDVSFGVKTSNGSASILVYADGNRLPSLSSDVFAGISSGTVFIRQQNGVRTVPVKSDRLQVRIDFQAGGALQTARLDYILVNYKRHLRIDSDGYLYFGLGRNRSQVSDVVAVDGADASLRIWDVTDHAAPVEMQYTLEGSRAMFRADLRTERRYIAFRSDAVCATPVSEGAVANQDLHSLAAPDMVIITPAQYREQSERIAEMHRTTDSMSVLVLTPEEIYNEFASGSPDVTAFRKLLKMWYDREGKPGYCLLMGRPTYDNRGITDAVKQSGYPRMPIWQSSTGSSQNTSYSTDDYIAMLDDNDTNLKMDRAKLRVSVGRMPVKSETEARQMVDKLIKYVTEPDFGAWRNQVMILADDQDNGIHLDQAEDVYKAMRGTETGRNYRYERLYLDSYPLTQTGTGAGYPTARERFYKMLDQGVMYLDYIGHANPKSWTHEGLVRYDDIIGMSNTRLPIIYAATCEFANWDQDDISGAEIMFLNPSHGVIAMVSACRPVYISPNGVLNEITHKFLFEPSEAPGGIIRLGDVYRLGKNAMTMTDDNKLRYLLMGDPALRIPVPTLQVAVDSIAGAPLTAESDAPVLAGGSRVEVSGRITDQSGATVTDFNGVLIPMLYDAERVIETNGNGSEGVKSLYNDRKNLLYTGKVKVIAGEWKTTLQLPEEIDNNYSPAMLSLYASSDSGAEAHGSTEHLYVYGWTDNTSDKEGPEILSIGLNNSAFKDGTTVNTTPVFLASVRDESGINISQSGIGHQITLTLDGTKTFDDVADYYEPDLEDSSAGDIRYVMPELEPGDHSAALTVWDNAGNSTTATINFRVSLSQRPTIYDVTTDVNPASTSVTFTISHDRPRTPTECRVEVFDLSGSKIWSSSTTSMSDAAEATSTWNLTDGAGRRVPRGIYLYRATVVTQDGIEATKTKKLAVTAQ